MSNQASHHPRGGSPNDDYSDLLPRGKLPINLQRSPGQTPVKDPGNSHLHSLVDDKILYHSEDEPSLRKIVGLKRMLQQITRASRGRKRDTPNNGGKKDE